MVLSGFCLYYPLAQRRIEGRPAPSTTTFFRRRAQRILPVYFAAIVFALGFIAAGFKTAPFRGWGDLVPTVFLVMNSMPDYLARVNGPLWSVAMECQLYLLLPVLAWGVLRYGLIATTSVALAVSATGSLLGPGVLSWGPVDLLSRTSMLPRLAEFACGVLAAGWVVSPRRWHLPVAGLLSVVALPVALSTWARTLSLGWADRLDLVAWGIVFGTIVMAGHRLETRGWFVGRGWSWWVRPLSFVGLISYSLYVVHFPMMLAMEPIFSARVTGPYQGLLLFTVTGLPVTLLVATAMYLLVERWSVPALRRSPVTVSQSDDPKGRVLREAAAASGAGVRS